MRKHSVSKQSVKARARRPIVDADRPIPLTPTVAGEHIERIIPALGITVGRVRSLISGEGLLENVYSVEEMAKDGGHVLYEEYGLLVVAVPRDQGQPRGEGELVIAYEPRFRLDRTSSPAVPHELGYILPDGRFVDHIEFSLLDGGVRSIVDELRKGAA